ncbi:ABC transporter ATP-binding protein/permease [Candidatus Wolfebacteria bacterium]|nr:ABC transporter ATP-binding protein/permease [Candidatus Wolfebacteria bacterium]
MKAYEDSTVMLSQVMKTFWRGIRTQTWAFYFVTVTFLVAYVIRLFPPLYYKRFFDTITLTGEARALLVPELVHILVAILLLQGIAWALFQSGILVVQDFESKVMARLKQMSFDYLIEHSYAFFADHFTGSLVQRVNRFSRAFERLYDTLIFNLIPLVVQVVGVTIIVWFQEPMISGIILVWAFLIVVFSYFFSRWKLKYDIRSAEADSTTTARLADTLTNQNAVTAFVGSDHESESFKGVSNAQAHAQRLTWNFSTILDGTQAGMILIIEFLVFYYAIKFWQRDAITIGTFVLMQVYIIGLAGQLWGFSRIVRNVYESFGDSKEMVEILEMPHDIKDVPGALPLFVREGRVEFKDLVFSFNETRRVLDHINLTIRGGEKVALIGPSGAGKSTMVKLLLRLYDPVEGSIAIDGQNTQKVAQESLRRSVSLVPQDPVLFHRTLMENIRYGRRDATDEEVIEAARLAHCDEFIDTLPLKYETYVGERGIKLSGGERQRVAIARAILKNAPILILDEATSSLDSHSEMMIQDALDKLMAEKTSIVIAHRLSTIRKMDRIIVIDGGKVVEEGSHDELVAQDTGLYKKLWMLQAGGFLPE